MLEPPRKNGAMRWMLRIFVLLLGCIECARCGVLLPMFTMSVCLSYGSTRLHCAKTAEQIKILFGVNTLGGPRNIVLDRPPDPPTARGEI